MWAGGNFGMAQTLFANVECWLKHMELDAKTGLDVPGINLRPAMGLEAVDYFVPGYAVWAKLIRALADLGYDSNNLVRIPASPLLSMSDQGCASLWHQQWAHKRSGHHCCAAATKHCASQVMMSGGNAHGCRGVVCASAACGGILGMGARRAVPGGVKAMSLLGAGGLDLRLASCGAQPGDQGQIPLPPEEWDRGVPPHPQ